MFGRKRNQGANRVTDVARDAADSRPMDWLARAGLAARGLIYLLMGVLAMLLGFWPAEDG